MPNHTLDIISLGNIPTAKCSCGVWGCTYTALPGESESDKRSKLVDLFVDHAHECNRNFFVTFGQRYRTEHHPAGGHPDGWFRIRAENLHEAQNKAMMQFGPLWSAIYREEDFDKAFYPKGELGVI